MPKEMKIQICTGKACLANFSGYMITRVENEKQKYDLKNIDCEPCLCL